MKGCAVGEDGVLHMFYTDAERDAWLRGGKRRRVASAADSVLPTHALHFPDVYGREPFVSDVMNWQGKFRWVDQCERCGMRGVHVC